MLSAKDFRSLQKLPLSERVNFAAEKLSKLISNTADYSRVGTPPVGPVQDFRGGGLGHATRVLMFGSNNYLNLNTHPHVLRSTSESLKKHGMGSGGSPYFSGYSEPHEALEIRLAALSSHDASMLLPSGYLANLCWVSGLVDCHDLLFYDKHSHASVFDGMKLSPGTFVEFDPDNLTSFEFEVEKHLSTGRSYSQVYATIEGVRSVDGKVINVPKFLDICRRNDIFSIVDDAHGLGVLGTNGYGTLDHFDCRGSDDLRMSTFSKALGCQGAFVSGSQSIITYLKNTASPFIFTTSLSLPVVAAVSAALDILESEPWHISNLQSNVKYLAEKLTSSGFQTLRNPSAILKLDLRSKNVLSMWTHLFQRGLFVNLIAYPLIAQSEKQFLRLSAMTTHDQCQITEAVNIIGEVARQLRSS